MSYLPPNFHYSGMYKVKAGKGYDQKGRPHGPIGGKCKECGGDIISLKMNTSSRGFETTAEKVCKDCGLTVPGAFQTLEPQPQPNKQPYIPYGLIDIFETHQIDYQTFIKLIYGYYDTNDQWIEAMKPEKQKDDYLDIDIDQHQENLVHLIGGRPNTKDAQAYGGASGGYQLPDEFDSTKSRRLRKAIARLSKTNASKKMDKQLWRIGQYHLIADDYIHMLELNKADAADVHWIINHLGSISKWPYNIDDIIYHLCLIIGNKDLRKYKEYNKRIYTLLTESLGL